MHIEKASGMLTARWRLLRDLVVALIVANAIGLPRPNFMAYPCWN